MHESAVRLYGAAKELKNVVGQSAVARLLGELPQTVKNWESRGVSKAGAIKAQEVIGCSATWVISGHGEAVAGSSTKPGGSESTLRNKVFGGGTSHARSKAQAVLALLQDLAQRDALADADWDMIRQLAVRLAPK